MSSAILYLAIVAIWACVLVPRWLRPRHADPQFEEQPAEAALGEQEEAAPDETACAESDEDLVVAAGAASADAGDTAAVPDLLTGQAAGEGLAPESAGAQPPYREDAPRPAPRGASPSEPGPPPPPPHPSLMEQRTRTLKARRRMLAILAVLTAGAAGAGVMHLAATWVIVPPAVMLAGFLVLLREASHSDAERTRRRTQLASGQAQSGASPHTRASGAVPAPGAVPASQAGQTPLISPKPRVTAQVIDISRRVGDQLYDQYSDAAERAVGD